MGSSDWLNLAALCLFRTQSVSKNKSIVTVLGQYDKVIDRHSYLIHSCLKQITPRSNGKAIGGTYYGHSVENFPTLYKCVTSVTNQLTMDN